MQSKKIEPQEVVDLKIASLPTRPTASAAFGGKGYTAAMMKEAFDKFPEFLLERLNLLIDDLLKEGEESYVGSFKTGITPTHTLKLLIDEIMGGDFSKYLMVNGKSLYYVVNSLQAQIDELKERTGG